ncbi:MAG: DNA polymerase domain-containing protein [Candidatus Aenigmatarchaeota archaeon]
MKVSFFLLDVDYDIVDDIPLIRIYGKTETNNSITIFVRNFFPYFYVKIKENSEHLFLDFLERKYKNLIVKVEKVEKYLPIGYQDKKTKLYKITLKNPSKVPVIREDLHSQDFVEKTFEADILFKYRFMADNNLAGCKWYVAEGEFVNHTKTVFTELKFEANKFEELEENKLPDFKILSFDIEVANESGIPDVKTNPISIISLSFYPEFEGKKSLVLVSKKVNLSNEYDYILSFENEAEMLKKFIEIVKKFDPDFLIGYNINNFDIPYIVERCRINKIKPYLGRAKKSAKTSKIGEERYKNSIVGRVIIDFYEILKEFSKKGMFKTKRLGLGDVAQILIGKTKEDVDRSEIIKLWKGSEEDLLRLIKYAKTDAELVLEIMLSRDFISQYIEISRLSGLLLQDSLSGSESSRIEQFLLREFNKEDIVIPNKPTKKELKEREKEEVKGAIVLEPKTGLHENVVYLDFKSLYPSLIIQYNICPTTYLKNKVEGLEIIETPINTYFVSKKVKEGIYPRVLKRLIEERDKVKSLMKKEQDPIKKNLLDAKQLALKLLANAFYGYSGYLRARFFVSDIANTITAYGRYWITRVKEIVEKELGYEVVYGDTDSVMVKIGNNVDSFEKVFEIGKKIEEYINSKTPEYIKMKIEGVMKKIIFITKKKYAGYLFEDLKDKGKIVMKGIETVRRDWCDLVTETLSRVIEILLIEGDKRKAFEYVRDIFKKLKNNEIDVEKLAIVKSISRPLDKYKGQQPHIELVKKMIRRGEANIPGVGDRVSYVIVAGPQKIVERAETPEYVKKNKIPIDADYYIYHQLLPPLERIFNVIGISSSQFITGSRQVSLLSLINNTVKNGNGNSENKQISKGIADKIKHEELIGFICNNCSTVYRRPTLNGICPICNGEIIFYSSSAKSKVLSF